MKSDDLRPATTEELLRFLDSVPAHNPSSGDGPRGGDFGGGKKSGQNCPPPFLYMNVVLGSCERAEGQALLNHAADCAACAQVLASSLRALEGDPGADEVEQLAELRIAQPKYQFELSQKLADSHAGKKPVLVPGGYQTLRWMGAVAATIAVVAGGFWAWRLRANAPERLLARAYQSSRTLELRIPLAGFSALQHGSHTRGAADGNEAPALLEARAQLARRLQRSPQDQRSVSLSARADLLEERYDEAIDKLDRLISTGPVTVDLLTDGATAYFERGLVTGRELDRTVALDYLRRADLLSPNSSVVLFNEAIVMEDRGQLLNAEQVWRRYLTLEHDPGWAAEGKRRLAALETILDKLKSHESRLMQMLSSPQAMNALAGDSQKLAQWDEELSSVELDKLTAKAFPGALSSGAQGARASPCDDTCLAARRLLNAVGISLKQQHHDTWLSDIFSAGLLPDSRDQLPPPIQEKYERAIALLGAAARQDQTGDPEKGASEAAEARRLFLEISRELSKGNLMAKAGQAGAWRAGAEYLFALQRRMDFAGCRTFADTQLRGAGRNGLHPVPGDYPWIASFIGIAMNNCYDTPDTRERGDAMGHEAVRLAVDAHYRLLTARAHLHLGLNSELAGDQELNEELVMNTERELLRGDSPLVRIINTRSALTYIEESFSRPYLAATSEQESVGWSHLAGDQREEVFGRMRLGITKIHLGAMSEAQTEFQAARAMSARLWPGEQTTPANNREILTQIAEALLERGELAEARRCLQATLALRGNSDAWMLSKSASVTGQLQLEQNNYAEAEQVLKTEILRQEGNSTDQSSPAGASAVQSWGIAEQDHDLYGELAAVWLAQGRPGEDVLALWERFRLRSQGLPIQLCPERRLDCERQALEVERQRMGPNRLTGEIVLMDRVLIYAMDEHGVHWQTRKYRRQDLLVAVKAMEGAVSSPLASSTTIELLGRPLADELLPEWPQELSSEATLFIEPDPQLNSLAWSVLPTSWGALGLRFAVAETPSILAHSAAMQSATQRISLGSEQSDARPLVIGASVTGKGTPPLPEAIEEAQGVGAFLHAPELLLGSHATARNVAAALSHASLLHFAGHAVQDDWGTRLLLANEPQADARLDAPPQPSWIDESFLRKHPPRACRLAVLSACATGGNVPSGDTSPRDLVKIFYSLGVPEVVATRWPVDSAASVSFMKAFYSRLESGQDVAHALQSARQSLFHGSTYGNSYFWGAYYATGQEEFPIEGERHAGVKDRSGNERAQKRSLQRGR